MARYPVASRLRRWSLLSARLIRTEPERGILLRRTVRVLKAGAGRLERVAKATPWRLERDLRPELAVTARPAVAKVERRRARAVERAPVLARELAAEPDLGMRRASGAGRERALGMVLRVVVG